MGIPISIRLELKKPRGKSNRLRKIQTGIRLTAAVFLLLAVVATA
jgi:hypothetical protein